MVKLSKTSKTIKITKQKQLQRVITKKHQPDKTLQKQRLLEMSFAKLNAELAKKDSKNDLINGYGAKKNIFMDILKIPPVVDLASVDDEASNHSRASSFLLPSTLTAKSLKQEIRQEVHHQEVQQEDLVLLDSASTTEEESRDATLTNNTPNSSPLKLSTKRRRLRPLKKAEKRRASLNRCAQTLIATTSESQLLKERLCKTCVDNIDKATIECIKSSEDLRQKFKQESIQSTSNADAYALTLRYTAEEILSYRPQQQLNPIDEPHVDYKTFASRIRFEHRSIQIDLSKNYKLVGLRYFQQILGEDIVSDFDKFIRVPLAVVSFNVLCQHYVETMRHLYQHLKGDKRIHELWNSRKQKLQLEFDRVDADVFCLQEVQDAHYEEFYQPYFASRKFQGIFTRKAGGVLTPDGCAIFWRQSKLTLLHINQVSYNLNTSVMDKPNVGQVAIFGLNDCLYNSSAVCISNTHIFFKMDKGVIKLSQIAYLLGHMKKAENEFLASMKTQTDPIRKYNFVGHILCGDFNIEPTSPLHGFLMERKIDLRTGCSMNLALKPPYVLPRFGMSPSLVGTIPLAKMRLTKNCELVDPNDSVKSQLFKVGEGEYLSHDFSFASVYEHFNVVGEPEVSSYHSEQSTPDFIFYTIPKNNQQLRIATSKNNPADDSAQKQQLAVEGFIQLRKRLSLPTLEELEKACGRLPNEQYGSDHLLICAEFDILCPLIVPSS